jgi:hypothetical protein
MMKKKVQELRQGAIFVCLLVRAGLQHSVIPVL